MFFPTVGGSTAYGRGTKFREPTGQRITTGNFAGALELDTSSSRHGADWTAPAGDFVLRTTSLRGWTAANAEHLHHTIFIKTANLVCRGAGDSHLPRSMRARSPHVLSPRRRFQPLRDEERSSESRRDSASPQGISPELSNLINQVLAIERIGPLRRGISCYARPTYAVGSRQMQSTCTILFLFSE